MKYFKLSNNYKNLFWRKINCLNSSTDGAPMKNCVVSLPIEDLNEGDSGDSISLLIFLSIEVKFSLSGRKFSVNEFSVSPA